MRRLAYAPRLIPIIVLSLQKLKELHLQAQKSKEEEDYLRFQYVALSEAALQPGQQEKLESELEAVTHSEIKSGLFTVAGLLSVDEQNGASSLRVIKDTLQQLSRSTPEW